MSSAKTWGLVLLGCLATGGQLQAKEDADTKLTTQIRETADRAVEYLKLHGQAEDGSYSKNPAITALATCAILRNGRTASDPVVAKSLKYIEGYVHDDGGIYGDGSVTQNYETCLGIMCLVAANHDGRYAKTIKNAETFLKKLQWDEGEGKNPDDVFYGGAGYGGSKRPDMSNTSFFLDALKSCGAGPEDEAIQKALKFVSRCQNLETENNLTEFAAKNPDGGFYYTCAAGGTSQAGKDEQTGGLRSYASMTYAGLKSMIYAGLKADDPRVVAATKWLKDHYDLKSNPGMGTSGLYYYYHTFAKSLDALGQESFVESDGKSHAWRAELASELIARQQENGSWVNNDKKWYEGDPNLVTGYALLALSYCNAK
jgi:squalene-hopene/tetraprenyl-beta-curcumene cyclase